MSRRDPRFVIIEESLIDCAAVHGLFPHLELWRRDRARDAMRLLRDIEDELERKRNEAAA